MFKRIVIFVALIGILPLNVLADTVTTNCGNIPVQESYNSTRVIGIIPDNTTVTKTNLLGEFYEINSGEIAGWINRSYTVEGVKEIENEKANTTNLTFVQVAAERKKYVRDYNYYYCQSGPIVPANYLKNRKTDCSAYVSDVIYHYGELKNWTEMMKIGRKSSIYFNGVGKNLKRGSSNSFFTLVPSISETRPGDILCYNGHVEIYAGGSSGGKPMVYNCGSNSSIKSENIITISGKSPSKLTYILRVKNSL